jgi:hypothetical protein
MKEKSPEVDADYEALVRMQTREQFVVACAYPFLVCRHQLVTPTRAQGTDVMRTPIDPALEAILDLKARRPQTRPWVRAIRKLQTHFPSMITVGRTPNHDIVLKDTLVSKFHAWFHIDGKNIELTDVGSKNGTFVNGERIPPHDKGLRLQLGDRLRFGQVELTLLDAEHCWNWLVQQLDEWD